MILTDQMLFGAGVLLMAVSTVAGTAYFVIWGIRRKSLSSQLDREYGKK